MNRYAPNCGATPPLNLGRAVGEAAQAKARRDYAVSHDRVRSIGRVLLVAFHFLLFSFLARAQAPSSPPTPTAMAQPATSPRWQYGGFLDAAYLWNFNYPANHLFRSRGTAYKVNEPILNMTGVYLRKNVTDSSRWGLEVTLHGGQDSRVFGFSATAPNLPAAKWLRHLGPTNASYRARVGNGLTMQAGIFSSLIGYDSLYAKDNLTYTRPWAADFTPYLMLGVNASYPFTKKLTGTVGLVNGYWHLGNANNVPSSVVQLAYRPTGETTLKQTVLFGPHQKNTSFAFWRVLSDSIAEWKGKHITVAFEYQISSERVDAPGRPGGLWMAGHLPMRWSVHGPWSVTVRPEFAWDGDGRWTLAAQTVKAVTTTVEYRLAYHSANAILRLEYRFDDSRGPGGGFFKRRESQPGVVDLAPSQHLLIFGAILTFDSAFH